MRCDVCCVLCVVCCVWCVVCGVWCVVCCCCFGKTSTEMSVYAHNHITTMHQSLRLIYMSSHLCDELLPRQPPPPTKRRSHRQSTPTVELQSCMHCPLPGASRHATTGMSNPAKNCTRTGGISAVCCTVCTVDASL